MNKIWTFLICISIICSLFFDTISDVNNSIFIQMENATNYIISFIALMGFWSGINNIILNTKIKNCLKKFLKPVYKLIYKKEFEDETITNMSLNTFGNLLGVGNIATISGLDVIKEIEDEKSEKLSDETILFTVMNTASIQIIPMTIINIRYMLGAENASSIIGYVWIVSFLAFVFLLIITKIYLRLRK